MLRSCLKSLVLLFLFIAVYYVLLRGRISPPGDRWGALALGFGMWIVSGLFWNTLNALSTRRKLKQALGGVQTFEDGQIVALAGTIRPLGEPLLAPFSRRPCVAYEYKLRKLASRGGQAPPQASGEALAPSVIEGPTGTGRLLAWPFLESFVETQFDGDEHRANALEFVAATTFEQATVSSAIAKLKELTADDDGSIKVDMNNGGEIDAASMFLSEKIVPAGARVCAVGRWSTAKGGIVPNPDSVQGVELHPGAVDTILAKLAGKARNFFIGSVVFAAIIHGIAWLALTQFEKDQRPVRVTELHQRVIDGDRDGVRDLLRSAEHYVNERDYRGCTALMFARSAEVAAMLLGIGADVNVRDDEGMTALLHAAGRGDTATLKLLLDRGADINAQSNAGTTALMHAVDQENPEALRFLILRKPDLELRDEEGRSALDRTADNPTAREILLAAGAIDQALDTSTAPALP